MVYIFSPYPIPSSNTWTWLCYHPDQYCINLSPHSIHQHGSISWPSGHDVWQRWRSTDPDSKRYVIILFFNYIYIYIYIYIYCNTYIITYLYVTFYMTYIIWVWYYNQQKISILLFLNYGKRYMSTPAHREIT